jgi:hypothetical protein
LPLRIISLALLLALILPAAAHAAPSATVQQVWVEHNVVRNNAKGMLIHAKVDVKGCKDVKIRENAYFKYQSGGGLKARARNQYSTPGGYVVCSQLLTPRYDSATFNDAQLFMPYEQLNMTRGDFKLSFNLAFYVETGSSNMPLLGTSKNVDFQYRR